MVDKNAVEGVWSTPGGRVAAERSACTLFRKVVPRVGTV